MYHQISFIEVWISIRCLFGEINCKVFIHMFVKEAFSIEDALMVMAN